VPTPHAAIESLFVEGPAGKLEALLNVGKADATHCALVCHPHPLFGGTMHNKVVFHAMKALHAFGFPVLRFNFRGAGRSQGMHDNGHGEQDDVRAGLAWLKQQFSLPVIFAGFSFGTAVGSRVACGDPDVRAIVSMGTPVEAEGRAYSFAFLAECRKPKLFLSGDHDEFAPHEPLERIVESAADPKELVFIPGDHYFSGHLDEMRLTIESWLGELLPHP
jgi:alpha/beta superfamily hydrolase